MKKMTSSLLVAFLLTMVGALMVGGATTAWFTSEAENNDNTFTSGTLEVSLDKPDGVKYFNIKNIAPGDSGSTQITISNTGSLELRFSVELVKEGALFQGQTPLKVAVEDNANGKNPQQDEIVLAAGESKTFTISWSMPSEAGNSYQGQSGTVGISVYAEQNSGR